MFFMYSLLRDDTLDDGHCNYLLEDNDSVDNTDEIYSFGENGRFAAIARPMQVG